MRPKLAAICKMPDVPAESIDYAAIVADDSALIRDNVRSALGPRCKVFVAANGIEAVEYARTLRPQIIVLDVRMPRMDGLTACVRIRDLPHCAHVPIVMLTAYDDAALRHRAGRAGATRVFAKPFTFETLRSEIRDMLGNATGAAAVSDATDRAARDGASPLDGREVLDVCRRAEAAAEARSYVSFAEAMQALHEADKY